MAIAAVLGGASLLGAVSQRSTARRAQRSQERALTEGRDITARATAQARGDVQRLFGQAQEQQALGFQQAQQLFGQAIPQQAEVFQAGNVAAQQQLLAGLPLFQSAILGGPLDFSTLQPTQLQQPDFSIFQQFATPTPEPEPALPDLAGRLAARDRFLAGGFGARGGFGGGFGGGFEGAGASGDIFGGGFRGLPSFTQRLLPNINQGGI